MFTNLPTAETLDAVSFGKELRRRRKAAGWTLERLAEESGLSPNYLATLETNPDRDPSLSTLLKIAKGLEVHPAVLLGGSAADGFSADGREAAALVDGLPPRVRGGVLQLLRSLPRRR
ncbi:MAG: helix-turn-helix transcriptional regulator [Myxococcales bacterium]|nr:helix-turn-helix transcriptional regulator [Myxococcales bacterium]